MKEYILPALKFMFLHYRASFQADIPTNGSQAKAGYEVEWLEDGVQVILRGVKKSETYYILPFKTLNG